MQGGRGWAGDAGGRRALQLQLQRGAGPWAPAEPSSGPRLPRSAPPRAHPLGAVKRSRRWWRRRTLRLGSVARAVPATRTRARTMSSHLGPPGDNEPGAARAPKEEVGEQPRSGAPPGTVHRLSPGLRPGWSRRLLVRLGASWSRGCCPLLGSDFPEGQSWAGLGWAGLDGSAQRLSSPSCTFHPCTVHSVTLELRPAAGPIRAGPATVRPAETLQIWGRAGDHTHPPQDAQPGCPPS